LKIALACRIKALFDILGYPEEGLRKSSLSMDKYFKSLCSYERKQLDRLVNTRRLIVTIPYDKRLAILKVLNEHWYAARKSFELRKGSKLLGLIGDITQTTPFGKYLYIALQHLVYVVLKFNSQFMFTSPKFSKFMSLVQAKDPKIARFFQSKLSKEI